MLYLAEKIKHILCCIPTVYDSFSYSLIFAVLLNEVLSSLGEHLCRADNYRQVSSEALIQTWWKITSNIKSTFHFLQVLGPWLQFACTHLSVCIIKPYSQIRAWPRWLWMPELVSQHFSSHIA